MPRSSATAFAPVAAASSSSSSSSPTLVFDPRPTQSSLSAFFEQSCSIAESEATSAAAASSSSSVPPPVLRAPELYPRTNADWQTYKANSGSKPTGGDAAELHVLYNLVASLRLPFRLLALSGQVFFVRDTHTMWESDLLLVCKYGIFVLEIKSCGTNQQQFEEQSGDALRQGNRYKYFLVSRFKQAHKRSSALQALFPEPVLDSRIHHAVVLPNRARGDPLPTIDNDAEIVAYKGDCPLGGDPTNAFEKWLMRLMEWSLEERQDKANPKPATPAATAVTAAAAAPVAEWSAAQVDVLIKEFIRPECTQLTLVSLIGGTSKLMDLQLNAQQERARHFHAAMVRCFGPAGSGKTLAAIDRLDVLTQSDNKSQGKVGKGKKAAAAAGPITRVLFICSQPLIQVSSSEACSRMCRSQSLLSC